MEVKNDSSVPEVNSSTVTKKDGSAPKKVESRKSLRRKLKNAEKESDALRKIIEEHNIDIEDLKLNKTTNTIKEQNEEVFANQNDNEIIKQNESKLKVEFENLKSQHATLKEKYVQLEEEVKKSPNSDQNLIKKRSEKETNDLQKIIADQNKLLEELKLNNMTKSEDKGKNDSTKSDAEMLQQKNEKLKAELKHLKSQYTILQGKHGQLEQEFNKLTKNDKTTNKKTPPCCNSASKVDSLSEQLATTKQKLFETLNQIAELKNNMKSLQKCLQQEIGDHVNISMLSSPGSNWRGRAQQIIALQNKVAELKERLELASLGDEPIRQHIRKLETTKNAEIEFLNKKIIELNQLTEDQKKKIIVLKNRNKGLCDDAQNYRLKTLNQSERTGYDNQTLTILQEKIHIQKYQYENQMMELRNEIENMEKEMERMNADHLRAKTQIQDLQNVAVEKDRKMEELQEVIRRLENDLKAACGDFLFSCREFKKDEFQAILDALEHEKQSLLKHIAELSKRTDEQRNQIQNFTEQLAKQRIEYHRLEKKHRDFLKEQETQNDKRKRSQRAADYARSIHGSLSTLVFESSKHRSSEEITSTSSLQAPSLETDELKNKLEYSNERIASLEDKLKMVAKEHENDFRSFNEIINSSKEVIVQMLLQHRKPAGDQGTSAISNSVEIGSTHDDFDADSLEETRSE